MKKGNIFAASVLALLVAAPGAFAQGALTGVDDLDDRIDDIQEDVSDDLTQADRRDRSSNQYAQGWTGSFALGFSATAGNTDTGDLDFAGRFRYGNGPWNHTIGFAGEFAEENSVRSKQEIYVTYDANRYFTESTYVFGLASARFDDFDSNTTDVFLGFGPGYRILNDANQSWRIQGGPGVRYVEDRNGIDTTEVAGIASSRYFYAVSDNVTLSMDTDILFSDEDTVITNDLGVNFKVTDRVSTRVSLRTDWDSDPLAGLKSTDNSLGVALVYGF